MGIQTSTLIVMCSQAGKKLLLSSAEVFGLFSDGKRRSVCRFGD
jgi:hypothetical protein